MLLVQQQPQHCCCGLLPGAGLAVGCFVAAHHSFLVVEGGVAGFNIFYEFRKINHWRSRERGDGGQGNRNRLAFSFLRSSRNVLSSAFVPFDPPFLVTKQCFHGDCQVAKLFDCCPEHQAEPGYDFQKSEPAMLLGRLCSCSGFLPGSHPV